MSIYRKIDDWMGRVIDSISTNRFLEGPLADSASLRRLERCIKDHELLYWGHGGPALTAYGIEMPCPRVDCTIRMVAALAHEYGHVVQLSEGRLLPRWNYNVSRAILMEELDASAIGTRALLDLDMWHPQHGFVLGLAWLGYLASWIQDWAIRHRQFKHRPLTGEHLEEAITMFDNLKT